jgi:hypothetical protein
MKRLMVVALGLSLAACAAGQAEPPAPRAPRQLTKGAHRIEITLERQEGEAWRAVDPGLVLESGDRVRFRFRANFDGYLYVMNQGTSGAYTVLFPREETGRENQIKSGQEYLVPATEAWFKVAGPPGFDIVYWLASPVALPGKAPAYKPLPPPPTTPPPPGNLLPRCDDAIFRARGLCVDSTAGPKQVPGKQALPENLAGVPGAASRELIIMRKENQSVVSSPAPLSGPIVYEFRLAHK